MHAGRLVLIGNNGCFCIGACVGVILVMLVARPAVYVYVG